MPTAAPAAAAENAPLTPLLVLVLSLPPLFWAGNFIVGRAVRGLVEPVSLTLLRWVLAFLFFLPFAWQPLSQAWRTQRPLYWAHRWRIVGVSLAGVAGFNSLVYTGLQYTTATNGILLNSFIPILIAVLGVLFYGARLTLLQAAGVLISFGGVLSIVLQGQLERLWNLSFGKGDLFVLGGVVSWAFYTLWLRGMPPQINRIALLAVQIVVGLLALLPLHLWELHAGQPPQWTWQSLGALLYLSIFPSVLAYLLYNHGVAKLGAARAGMSIHLMPLFGTVLSILLLGEQWHLYHAVGMGGILLGIVLTSRK